MYAPLATAIRPMKMEVELVQAENGSLASPPAGTWPEATAPIAQPKKNGVSKDERAQVAPRARASPIVAASPRTANAAPRKMIPTPARNSGT